MPNSSANKTLLGKYQIKENMFVQCFLEVFEANDREFKTFIGIKRQADVVVPIGTRIYLNADSINKIISRRSNSFEQFFVIVKGLGEQDNRPLQICTPLSKEAQSDRRETPRIPVNFSVSVATEEGEDIVFSAKNGTAKGLTLQYKSKHILLGGINLNNYYDFRIPYKGQEYFFKGVVKHIHYNWKTHEHVIGVCFEDLKTDSHTILSLLIDPNYRIDISHKETIDPITGKVIKE
ncbi:MAG: PilZ domain-containing protein [Cyanobacteria bacterium]|nr:PilZ domain-containing protein [Cyanobacteriota bacterium]